jgi:hypothetical protein
MSEMDPPRIDGPTPRDNNEDRAPDIAQRHCGNWASILRKYEMSEISKSLRAAETHCPKNAPWPGRTPYLRRTLTGVSLQKGSYLKRANSSRFTIQERRSVATLPITGLLLSLAK